MISDRTRITTVLCALVFVTFALPTTLTAQWSTITIDDEVDLNGFQSPYRCWTKFDGTTIDNVLYLSNPYSTPVNDFCSQLIYHPQAFPSAEDDRDTLVMGAAGSGAPQKNTGDAVGLIFRRDDGRFNANPNPDATTGTSVVLRWPIVDTTTMRVRQWHGRIALPHRGLMRVAGSG